MLQVTHGPVVMQAGPVVIDEGEHGAGQRHTGMIGGRFKRRDHADQIGKEDEDGNGADQRQIFARAVLNVLIEQIADADAHGVGQHHFQHLLGGAGFIRRNARADP